MTDLILTIENATPDNGTFCARAIVFQRDDETGAMSVADIFESENIDTLRDVVKSHCPNVTHYRGPVVVGGSQLYRGGWADALRVAKDLAYELAIEEGADVRKNMSLRHLVEHKMNAIAAREERERLDAERDAEQARAQAAREERAAERKDFDAWAQMARAAREDDVADYRMGVLMRWAYNETDAWEKRLAEHVAKLTENPVYALSWSGDFIQSAADFEVASYIVRVFEDGISGEEMEDLVMRELFNKSDRAVSRSTSVMSNLTDDVVRVAWTSAAKRITGRSFW